MKNLEERDWGILLSRIKKGDCTPFLGAGACFGFIPLGSRIAHEWARKHTYPLTDSRDLARVAQFLAVEYDSKTPKEKFVELLETITPPNFHAHDEPHGVLADLPLPIYMTTNYDDFMVRALRSQNKDPRRELCRWNELVKDQPSIFESEPGFSPTPANPVVFHLHGHNEVPESLVLTEDDYLDFLVQFFEERHSIPRREERPMVPRRIERALATTSLLFIGYRLADWSFRVLFRCIIGSLPPSSRRLLRIAVQLAPDPGEGCTREQVQGYLENYFATDNVRVYWRTARDFAKELRERWEAFNEDN